MTLFIGLAILADKKASQDGKTLAFLFCVVCDVLILLTIVN